MLSCSSREQRGHNRRMESAGPGWLSTGSGGSIRRGANGPKHREQGACVAGGKSNASSTGSNNCCTTSHQSGGRPQRPLGAARGRAARGKHRRSGTRCWCSSHDGLGWQVPGLGRMGRTGLRHLTVWLATVLQLTEVATARCDGGSYTLKQLWRCRCTHHTSDGGGPGPPAWHALQVVGDSMRGSSKGDVLPANG